MAPAAESSAAATRRKSGEIAVPDPRSGEETEAEGDSSSATRFSPGEEATLLSQSHTEKLEANELFKSAQYSQAISVYDRALASVPNYLEYEIAVLKSNVAACHLKLADWKAAVDEATKSLEALDRLDGPPPPTPSTNKDARDAEASGKKGDDDGVVELADEDGDEGEALEKLQKDDRRKDDIRRIRIKALMRRARARTEQGGWGNLQGALE
ncbi:MAG: hypothetical protein Q9212_007517, partial [Teloschistes hypoglaucus]